MGVVFNDRLGNPVEPWVQYTLDLFFSKKGMGTAEREFYNELIHESEHCFENYNRHVCSDCRLAGKESYASKERGCCTKCASNKGYIFSDMNREFEKIRNDAIEHLWTNTYGYFDNEKHCCKIPRHLRPRTCLGFSCSPDTNFFRGVKHLTEAICYLKDGSHRNMGMVEEYIEFQKCMHKQLYTY